MKKLLFLLFAATCATATAQQMPRNYGLTEHQDPATLPRSRAATASAILKTKQPSDPAPIRIAGREYLLRGGWKLASANQVAVRAQVPQQQGMNVSDWYNATVPGTILTTLVDNGVFPNPYFGLNNLSIPDTLCRTDWWYRLEFATPAEAATHRAQLLFEGINYQAEVWFNDTLLGNMAGAFLRGAFDIGGMFSADAPNVLAVHVYPPCNPGIPHEESASAGMGPNGGQLCMDGATFISSEGWDWVPGVRDRNTGIWQDVKLRFTGDVRLDDPQVVTDLPLPDTTSVRVILRTGVKNLSDTERQAVVTFAFGDVKVSKSVWLAPASEIRVELTPDEFPALYVQHPQLWWPNGYGKPNLYNALVTISDGGGESDARSFRFGIRELSYDLTVCNQEGVFRDINFNPTAAYAAQKPVFDMIGRRMIDSTQKTFVPRLIPEMPVAGITPAENSAAPYLVIRVNGKRIFIRGGNWGMDDAMKRVSRERLEPYIRFHREQNFNMIRNWTGESTEEVFYDLCDEYGILVFNDFSLSTEGYNLNPNDNELMLRNAEDIITRFRNHASIAMWCPRNEGYAPDYLERGFSAAIAAKDGTRHYSGNSIHMNLTGSGPWGLRLPSENFETKIARGFSTELGTTSVPTAETMRRMMSEEDLWPIGDVWSYHDWHVGGWLAFDNQVDYMTKMYGKSDNVDDFCRKAQLLNYDAYRAIFEAFGSCMWRNTTGVLLWMSHPAWPSVTWQTYSFDYETPAAYFASRKACEPFHVQMRPDDRRIQVVNTRSNDVHTELRCNVYDLSGKRIFSRRMSVAAKAETTTDCFTPDTVGFPKLYLVRLTCRDTRTGEMTTNDYWMTPQGGDYKAFETLPAPVLKLSIPTRLCAGKYRMTLTNTGKTIALSTKLNIRQSATDEAVLPAYFSEGYFMLLPGESKTLEVEFSSEIMAKDKLYLSADTFNGGRVRLTELK